MSNKRVLDFFKNKVTIKLKTGHQFRGLLREVDYKSNIIILEDIEDMGNTLNQEQLPLDRKIPEKAFEAENIEEIILADKLFAEPKKYQKDDFFDSMTEHKDERGPRGKNSEERGDYRPRRGRGGNRGGNYREDRNYERAPRQERQYDRNYDRNYDKPKRTYEERGRENNSKEEDDREYR